MKTIPISEFKATCLAVLERVRRTKEPVLLTRFGEPVAEIGPPSQPPRTKGWVGAMAGTGKILGDIVSPVMKKSDWEAAR